MSMTPLEMFTSSLDPATLFRNFALHGASKGTVFSEDVEGGGAPTMLRGSPSASSLWTMNKGKEEFGSLDLVHFLDEEVSSGASFRRWEGTPSSDDESVCTEEGEPTPEYLRSPNTVMGMGRDLYDMGERAAPSRHDAEPSPPSPFDVSGSVPECGHTPTETLPSSSSVASGTAQRSPIEGVAQRSANGGRRIVFVGAPKNVRRNRNSVSVSGITFVPEEIPARSEEKGEERASHRQREATCERAKPRKGIRFISCNAHPGGKRPRRDGDENGGHRGGPGSKNDAKRKRKQGECGEGDVVVWGVSKEDVVKAFSTRVGEYYVCPHFRRCNSSFKAPGDLFHHLSLHANEVLYTCKRCDCVFDSESYAMDHADQLHPEVSDYDDVMGVLSFPRASGSEGPTGDDEFYRMMREDRYFRAFVEGWKRSEDMKRLVQELSSRLEEHRHSASLIPEGNIDEAPRPMTKLEYHSIVSKAKES